MLLAAFASGYPGAFTPTCSDQVPSYISNYDAFAAKVRPLCAHSDRARVLTVSLRDRQGVTDIYAIAINDVFVQKAFKQKLAPEGTKVRFVADSDNGFLASLGLVFDASGLLGGIRSKRFALYAEEGVIKTLLVEDSPGELKKTGADDLLAAI